MPTAECNANDTTYRPIELQITLRCVYTSSSSSFIIYIAPVTKKNTGALQESQVKNIKYNNTKVKHMLV
jgi:hypothetical protein